MSRRRRASFAIYVHIAVLYFDVVLREAASRLGEAVTSGHVEAPRVAGTHQDVFVEQAIHEGILLVGADPVESVEIAPVVTNYQDLPTLDEERGHLARRQVAHTANLR